MGDWSALQVLIPAAHAHSWSVGYLSGPGLATRLLAAKDALTPKPVLPAHVGLEHWVPHDAQRATSMHELLP